MSELRTMLAAAVLACGVAAATGAGVARIAAEEWRPRVVSVRLAGLAAEHAAEAARRDAAPAETAAAARAWGLALEEALGEIAARGNLTILPARAVAVGAPDITGPVRRLLAEKLARAAPEAGR